MAASNATEKSAVVVAIDSSPQAETALDWYLDNLHREEYEIVLVFTIDLPETYDARTQYLLFDEKQNESKQLEDKYRIKLRERALHGQLKIMAGKPGEAVIKAAEVENACMIVTGSRGLGTVKRALLGSVSDYLIHHAKCPVVVCKS